MAYASIMRVPAQATPGAGYAIPGNRGFTGQRFSPYGSAPTDPVTLQQLAAGASWQTPAGTPRPRGACSPETYLATVPVPTAGGAPVSAPPPTPTAAVDGGGALSRVRVGGSARCSKPCMFVRVGVIGLILYGAYTWAT